VKVYQALFTVHKKLMVIQSTAGTGQIPVQLLTTITALLLAAAFFLLFRGEKADSSFTTIEESEE